jgi:hypothetical protein
MLRRPLGRRHARNPKVDVLRILGNSCPVSEGPLSLTRPANLKVNVLQTRAARDHDYKHATKHKDVNAFIAETARNYERSMCCKLGRPAKTTTSASTN